MKVVIPYVGELHESDARMARLVEFLGIPCDTTALTPGTTSIESLRETFGDEPSCMVLNPRVMEKWLGRHDIAADIVGSLAGSCHHLLVYGARVDHPFDNAIVAALSGNRLQSVRATAQSNTVYEIASDSTDICGAFSGLSFGPTNPANDHVFSVGAGGPLLRPLVSIAGSPFMAVVKERGSEVLFVASEDVADLNAEVGDAPLTEYFSRLVPHAMALRYAAGDACWRPGNAHASIVIDDPLLRKSYGFLDFLFLRRLADEHNFHATIAFIPHNFRRNSSRITRMFQENAARLSICFHGNDHTEGEFASTDQPFVNALLKVAEDRMNVHQKVTGLPCDKVMVFPQGKFSIEAMRVLKSRDFDAAVNTIIHPAGQPVRLTIGELAQPAVLRYGGFPLFIRKCIRHTQSHDIAFRVFFGRPVLIVEHHEIFQYPQSIVEFAARMNAVAPEVRWSNLATAVAGSVLTRRAPDGSHHVRAYARSVRLSNDSAAIRRYSVEWSNACDGESVEQVLMDGTPCAGFQINDAGIRVSVELPPGGSRTLSLVYRKVHTTVRSLGVRWDVQAFLRRRLSEVRDNYLSKNQRLLAGAKTLQRRFLRV